ncbi:MAG: 4-(cytidine 5'-diphospho)-2-C-methyl-D-erythritol kinase [Tannerella sp.]|jgi:4-diphosphocytidyl-2-C-methyl-D-erythritol kinase|nr:4-(cytidine 5'-diphospho)-2-C-methyl-D-erythritol kinase [Tannerella sp.]
MICFPNAKINLGLHVTGKRDDGYHTIETVFYPVPLCDALEAVRSEKVSFSVSSSKLNIAHDNLVVKAYNLLLELYKIQPLEIYLKKAIPIGAGLGGGSADAAFMLKLINSLCSLTLSDEELELYAAKLGADCPFFIRNKPVIATGTGNIFTPIDLSLKGYYLYIIKPPVSVSTKEAYSLVKPLSADFELTELATLPISCWRDCLRNDFEPYIFKKYPVIGEIKAMFYEQGAEYAAMSGSGSAVFGIFTKPLTVTLKMKQLIKNCFVWSGEL